MDTPSSIEKYNQNTQRHRLYQFVWALDDHRYGKITRDILNMVPIPTTRKAYGLVRRESVNEKLLNPETKESGIQSRPRRIRQKSSTHITTPPTMQPLWREETHHGYVFPHPRVPEVVGRDEEGEAGPECRLKRRRQRGGRASAAIALDRATYTENPAGGSGGNSSVSEIRTEEKPTIASVSVARTWSEGKISSIGDLAGGGSGEEGAEGEARVPTGEMGEAARVSEKNPKYSHLSETTNPSPKNPK